VVWKRRGHVQVKVLALEQELISELFLTVLLSELGGNVFENSAAFGFDEIKLRVLKTYGIHQKVRLFHLDIGNEVVHHHC
jgi:hypothetical protein